MLVGIERARSCDVRLISSMQFTGATHASHLSAYFYGSRPMLAACKMAASRAARRRAVSTHQWQLQAQEHQQQAELAASHGSHLSKHIYALQPLAKPQPRSARAQPRPESAAPATRAAPAPRRSCPGHRGLRPLSTPC